MPLLLWIIVFSLLGGVLSVLAAASFLFIPEARRRRVLPGLVSFAIGALLGAAFIGLLPQAFQDPAVSPDRVGGALLLGVLLFFVLEKMVLWRHSHAGHAHDGHGHEPEAVTSGARSAGVLIVIGDGIHNMVDGVLIAAAFMTDLQLGVLTSLAVAAHEIPQELGDFAILLHAGFRPRAALALNLASTLTTVVGAVIAWFTLSRGWLPYVLALAAASFIYIAVADLIPGLHRSTGLGATLRQVLLIALGTGFVLLGHLLLSQA
jgi:zinc and cadmium transporter